jgi:hypothetical protein
VPGDGPYPCPVTYSPVQRLGRGGMGVVDLAVDDDGNQVAVKRLALHGSIHDMHRARQRVRREAAALATLDHPGVVRLLDVVDDGDDIVLVMPYLSGGTLTDRVRAHGPMPPAMVQSLADQLLGALASAHRAGIVHRDIKPANVLFDQAGNAYLTDFGVATMRDATSGLTATEVVVGTPEFMAPEQARGERATPASDVFSLGATLRYAATGTPPYGRGDGRVILNRAAEGKLERLPVDLPRDLRDRLGPMLDKRPDRRPTAAAAAGGSAGGTEVLASWRRKRGRRPVGSRVWPAVAAIAVIALVAVAATAVALDRTRTSSAAVADSAAPATSPSSTCTPLAYQPCGRPVAPFTDGVRCTDDHADYDADTTNGCEAAPDTIDGSTLNRPITTANLVPAGDIDRYPFHVNDNLQLFCDGALHVTLTAPAGVAMRLDVLRSGDPLATTVSTDGEPATITLGDPSCLGDDGTDLQARVSWVGDRRSAMPYTLERDGSY